MRKMIKDLCLLMSFLILILPAGAVPGELSGSGNLTEEPGLNSTENVSRNYFDSDSGLICIAAGKVSDSENIIPADDLVENITFLTDSPESELSPVWTADGEYILYTVERNESDGFESYRMKANGSEIERTGIGEGNLTGFNDLSLDGRELILTKSTGSQLDLYMADMENGALTPVANDPQVSESGGSWCRLGKRITYTQESAGSPSQLWIVNRNGNNKTRLGTSENVGTGKDWCPLGLRVIYSAKDSQGRDDLWVIDYHGTNQTQLTNTSYNEWNPSFSPDGKWIAYVSDEGGSPDIWIRDIEGNYRAGLTNNTGIFDSVPMWSPDGSKIVFEGRNPGNNSVTDSISTEMINGSNSSGSNINGSDIDLTNGSDIDLTDGLEAALSNGMDEANTGDSEIVVIKLLSAL
jgi:Tol biopolymer transport system component